MEKCVTYHHKCIWPALQKGSTNPTRSLVNASWTPGLCCTGGVWGVLSSSLFYKTVRGEEARTEHPKCPAQSLSPASELPGSWRFLQRCSQLTPCSVLFSQVPCKIGVACNHSNSISGVCKLFKCRCKLYSQRQAESLLKIYILNLFVFYNPNVFFQLFFTFFLTVFHSLPSPLYLGGGVLARAMQIVNRQQFLKSYK